MTKKKLTVCFEASFLSKISYILKSPPLNKDFKIAQPDVVFEVVFVVKTELLCKIKNFICYSKVY